MRVAWIFKTETIVMPAVLDSLGGAAWLRGFLPMLSRIGQSIPPFICSDALLQARLKKKWLFFSSLVMGVAFLLMAWAWEIWLSQASLLACVFLTLYAVFFASTGINQLALATLHGKLVLVNRRGRLMLIANFLGSLLSVSCAWLLLRHWLQEDRASFIPIFLTSGLLFVIGAVIGSLLSEKQDVAAPRPAHLRRSFALSWQCIRQDPQLRILLVVGFCYGMTFTLFPHYQAIGLQRLQLDIGWLVPWLIAQNLGVGLLSIPAGACADRFGNLLVLRILLGSLLAAPLLALGLSTYGPAGAALYFLVFALLGVSPVVLRILKNLVLEMADQQRQPTYLSTLMIFVSAAPILCSWLVGFLIDVVGFESAILAVASVLLAGCLLTWRLDEPRHVAGPGLRQPGRPTI